MGRDANVDPEIRRKTLGHADQAMTSHYTHIEAQAHRAAAEAVARLWNASHERMFPHCSPKRVPACEQGMASGRRDTSR